jgi:hypothetical protein
MFHNVVISNATTLKSAQCAIAQCSHNVVIESRRDDANAKSLAVEFWHCAT